MVSSSPKDKSGGQARISLRVQPNAARNEVIDFSNGVWRIKVAAPPLKGKANKELITFLSRSLGVGKEALAISKGLTRRSKVITIDGLSQEEVRQRLSSSSANASR